MGRQRENSIPKPPKSKYSWGGGGGYTIIIQFTVVNVWIAVLLNTIMYLVVPLVLDFPCFLGSLVAHLRLLNLYHL